MSLDAAGLLATVVSVQATAFTGPDALAVHDRGAARGITAELRPLELAQCRQHPLPLVVFLASPPGVVDRLPRRQIVRQPLAPDSAAALLTVIGYSVNDSVVLFDRIRELARRDRAAPFSRIADQALLQTLPRTVNTGMGSAFILTALAVLGGDTLTDFALALLIGLAVGTHSSMFTATPLAVELHSRA
ncbi:hypothetical protein ACFWOB_13545 [Streptomyces sp. NPDC058420]|uniref:hypothetical protein n=1 Tax=Streptomyces sp. NPDC058420 TaxID=3346489 RepID=UPI003652F13F